MKLRQDEIQAIVYELLKKQQAEKKAQKDAFQSKVDGDGRFEALAKMMKEHFIGFEQFFNFSEDRLQDSVRDLAKFLREEYVGDNMSYKGIKKEHQLRNEVILAGPKFSSFDEIIASINVFSDED